MNKNLFRLVASAELMSTRGRLRFGTLTVRLDGLPLRVVADMWRSFSNSRWWRSISRKRDYILVYEPHPNGHGWHIHFLCNFYIPIRDLVYESSKYGFGVAWMESVSVDHVYYISKYISKSRRISRREGSKGVRLVNVSRSMLPLSDVIVSSPMLDYVKSNWHIVSGSHKVRWLKLCWNWLTSWCPALYREEIV